MEKKKFNKLLNNPVTYMVCSWLFAYLTTAFVVDNFNCHSWDVGARIFTAFFGTTIGVGINIKDIDF